VNWLDRGWQAFAPEASVETWRASAGPVALRVSAREDQRATWLRHGGTWFVGVDALPNGPDGAVAGGPPLGGAALQAAQSVAGALPLHPGQVSVTYPGYPRQDPGESDAAHRFRRDRDAAHLDGLLLLGPEKRRYLREFHAFILGIALTDAAPDAAPLVVWEGSHHLVRAAFAKAFDSIPADRWPDIDMTDTYQSVRRQVFASCPRREVPLSPGQTVLVHRHAIHGVAPWAEGAKAAPEGRAIVYFRPEVARKKDWLDLA
jgi:hypothetical protein